MNADNRGFTLIELLVVVALIGILSAIAIHHVLASKATANEASAIGTMRAVHSGQVTYASTCARGAFAPSLTRLVSGRFISPDLLVSPKSGYGFTLTGTGLAGPNDCHGDATSTTYYASVQPVVASAGRRAFAVNAGGTIWQNTAGLAPTEPFTAGGSISPLP